MDNYTAYAHTIIFQGRIGPALLICAFFPLLPFFIFPGLFSFTIALSLSLSLFDLDKYSSFISENDLQVTL